MQHIYNQEDDEKKISSSNGVYIHTDRGNVTNNYPEADTQHYRSTLGSPQTEPPKNKAVPRPINEPPSTPLQTNDNTPTKQTVPLSTINTTSHSPDRHDSTNITSQDGISSISTKATLNLSAKVFIPKGYSNKASSKCKVMETITERNESDSDVQYPNGNNKTAVSPCWSKYDKLQLQQFKTPIQAGAKIVTFNSTASNISNVKTPTIAKVRFAPLDTDTETTHNRFENASNNKFIFNNVNKSISKLYNKYNRIIHHKDLPKRLKGIVTVPFEFTAKRIPHRIREEIHNVYEYMDKAMAFTDNKTTFQDTKGNIIVAIDFGFHGSDSEPLYCVMEQDNSGTRKWRMEDELFTVWEIMSIYCTGNNFFVPSRPASSGDTYQIDKTVIKNTFNTTNFSRIPIYGKRKTKKRRVLHITQEEFSNIVKQTHINHNNIIPIISVHENTVNAENVMIFHLSDNTSIGISYKLESSTNKLQTTGIYLDKDELLTNHQLASPDHKCHCLDNFVSNIDELKIGNVYENENKIKALKKANKKLRNDNKKLVDDNKNPIIKYIKQVLNDANDLISNNIKTALLSIKHIFNLDTIKKAIEKCLKTKQNHVSDSQLLPMISSNIPTSNIMETPMQYLTSIHGNIATTIQLPQSAIT